MMMRQPQSIAMGRRIQDERRGGFEAVRPLRTGPSAFASVHAQHAQPHLPGAGQ